MSLRDEMGLRQVDPKPKQTEQVEDKLKNVHLIHGSLVTNEPIVYVWMNGH